MEQRRCGKVSCVSYYAVVIVMFSFLQQVRTAVITTTTPPNVSPGFFTKLWHQVNGFINWKIFSVSMLITSVALAVFMCCCLRCISEAVQLRGRGKGTATSNRSSISKEYIQLSAQETV